MDEQLKFTHEGLKIDDIYKVVLASKNQSFYKIKFHGIDYVYHLSCNILDDKVKSYLFTDNVTRENIIGLKYNVVITEDGFNTTRGGTIEFKQATPGNRYINFIIVDSELCKEEFKIWIDKLQTKVIV